MLLASFSRVRRFFVLWLGLAAASATLLAQVPATIDGYDPDVDGNVFVLAMQADGKLLVGGQFTSIRGVPRNNLARLNADGSVDTAFNPSPNGAVRAIVIQPDGRIVFGGDFTGLQPGGVGTPLARGCIARLNADGSIDSLTYTIGGNPLKPQVFALALQPDGAIVVGGSFTSVSPGQLTVIFFRQNLFRIAPNGSLDLGFDPNPNAMVLALAAHVDNKLVLGGAFTSLWPAGDAVPSSRNRIARLNANGTVDSEFNPNANNGVTSLAVQRDGKLVLGGFFTTLQPIGEENPANRPHIARLNPNGTIDSEFYPHAEGNVSAVALQPDGSLLVGGTFGAVWGRGSNSVARANVARFNPDGSLDLDFAPVLNGEVDAFAFQPDGKVLLGGYFTRAQPVGAATALIRNHLARVNADGSFDTSFELDSGGRILTSITQSDGKVVIAGTFTSVGGASHNYLARLNADGTVDTSYNPDLNGRVYTMAYDAATNKVLIGGAFTTITTTRTGTDQRNHIARLNADGTPDSEFNPNIDGQVGVIVVQPDGKLLVGGTFASLFPIGATATTNRSNLLRLNANGSLDTAFDPSPNSSVSAIALQSDGKILVGGLFSALTPGFGTNTSATTTSRGFLARLNTDGTLDTAFKPTLNAQVTAIAVQSDNKVIIGGAFTNVTGADVKLVTVTNANGTTSQVAPTRNHIARLTTEGNLDDTYDPNANGTVLAIALQSDGKALIGGAFTTLQPNGASTFTLRKYAARLNADGTVDSTFNLDLSELRGNRVDSIRIQSDGRVLIGGAFTSLQPIGASARTNRRNFVRLTSAGQVDLAFDPGAGGSTTAVVNGFAVQADNKIVAVGNFSDLGGAKSTNIARFLPEGGPDPEFSNALTADGPINAVAVRPNAAATPSQLSGFAWLTANGTLRSGFNPGTVRLSGEVNAIAVDDFGRVLLGGSFTNLDNPSSNNFVRFNANGTLDSSFTPNPNGRVVGIAVQRDGRIVIIGNFTTVRGDVIRNRIARIDDNGSVDVTFDPNPNGAVHAIVIEGDNRMIVGGAFSSFTPNAATTAVTRNNLARINFDGTIDAYDPNLNAAVNALALQADGKVLAGGAFSSVQPNGGTTAFNRNGFARFNADGTLDQNFDPNPNAPVNALVALPNGQILVGGSFTTLQQNQTGAAVSRNNLARVNSDGAVDASFNPNANGAVTSLALQSSGAVLVGGGFTTLQPNATGAALTRNHLARVNSNGSVDADFNPDVNGTINALLARPDGTVVVGGRFTELQLIGSIVIGGNFASIGGVTARNLAMLNENGSVNASFQPRPDGPVNAILVQPDGKMVVGGAFTSIAGATRARVARFNADGTLDTAFNPPGDSVVRALALLPDGKLLVAGSSAGTVAAGSLVRLNPNGSVDATFPADSVGLGVTALAVQADGRIIIVREGSGVRNALVRLNSDGSVDAGYAGFISPSGFIDAISLQADGRVIVGGDFSVGTPAISRLARLDGNGALDTSFNPAPNGRVTALTLQPDGRVVIGGSFNTVAGQSRVGVARVNNTSAAIQSLGVAANRSSVTWTRGGTTGEISAALFELSTDHVNWTLLGNGSRIAGTSNWQLTGLNLPASGLFYIRARGLVSARGTSAGVYESVREFTFTNPVPALSTGPLVVPTQTTAAQLFDPSTGITPRAAVSVVPGEGTVEIFVASQVQSVGTRPARLANLSTRGRVTADTPLILGFAIAGSEERRVLVRAVGPGLAGFGVGGVLPATRLQIYDAAGRVLASNEGWANASDVVQAGAATGAFPLGAGSADSAAVLTLVPGNYTMQVVDVRGAGGIGLAEIYDAGSGDGARLVNVSSRGAAGTGASALISGFVIAGDVPQRVLLRGVGPGLSRFGTGSVLADPAVSLFDSAGYELGSNDNWVSSGLTISSAAASAGAFALEPGSKDAAVLATLPSGAYTIQVRATSGQSGNALLEIYEIR